MVSGRHHSKAVKIAATVLARLAGEVAASEAFGVDRRTVRAWMTNEDVPTDSWAALDDLAGAQLLEKVARGRVTNPATLATVRGIASRNRRYSELIAERRARREDAEVVPLPERRRNAWRLFESPNSGPDRVAVVDEDEERLRQYLHCATAHIADELRDELAQRAREDEPEGDVLNEPGEIPTERGDLGLLAVGIYAQWCKVVDESEHDFPPPDPPDDALVGAWSPDMTDEAHAAFLAMLRPLCIAKAREWWPSYQAAQEAQRVERESVEHAEASRRHEVLEPSAPVAEPIRLPTARAARPAPVSMVVDASYAPDTWEPYERRDQ